MKYTDVQNPTWNIDRSAINCMVTFEEIGTVPFSAIPEDRHSHVVEIYARCIAGDFGPIADYVPAPDEGPQPPTIRAKLQIPVTDTGAIL